MNIWYNEEVLNFCAFSVAPEKLFYYVKSERFGTLGVIRPIHFSKDLPSEGDDLFDNKEQYLSVREESLPIGALSCLNYAIIPLKKRFPYNEPVAEVIRPDYELIHPHVRLRPFASFPLFKKPYHRVEVWRTADPYNKDYATLPLSLYDADEGVRPMQLILRPHGFYDTVLPWSKVDSGCIQKLYEASMRPLDLINVDDPLGDSST